MKKPISLVEVDGTHKLNLSQDLTSHLATQAYYYLQPHGWFNDCPSDEEGFTPWYTFPAIAFLKDIISKDWRVFEYGGGYSSLYFKNKVNYLVTIEHNQEWGVKLLKENNSLDLHIIRENSGIHPESQKTIDNFFNTFEQVQTENETFNYTHGLKNREFAGYASMIYQAQPNFYDVVAIDGMARMLCTFLAVESNRLKEDSIIILDNSDRPQYNQIQDYLNKKGFGRLDFWGPGWSNYEPWCTSFYSKKFPVVNNKIVR